MRTKCRRIPAISPFRLPLSASAAAASTCWRDGRYRTGIEQGKTTKVQGDGSSAIQRARRCPVPPRARFRSEQGHCRTIGRNGFRRAPEPVPKKKPGARAPARSLYDRKGRRAATRLRQPLPECSSPSARLPVLGLGLAAARRLARLCSICLSASVSVMRLTEEISRTTCGRARLRRAGARYRTARAGPRSGTGRARPRRSRRRSPELILASYSWARRDHMVRLTRARPVSTSSAFLTSSGSASLRMPTRWPSRSGRAGSSCPSRSRPRTARACSRRSPALRSP